MSAQYQQWNIPFQLEKPFFERVMASFSDKQFEIASSYDLAYLLMLSKRNVLDAIVAFQPVIVDGWQELTVYGWDDLELPLKERVLIGKKSPREGEGFMARSSYYLLAEHAKREGRPIDEKYRTLLGVNEDEFDSDRGILIGFKSLGGYDVIFDRSDTVLHNVGFRSVTRGKYIYL